MTYKVMIHGSIEKARLLKGVKKAAACVIGCAEASKLEV